MRKTRIVRTAMLALLIALLPAHAFAGGFDFGSTWRSVLLPGSGQAHQGNYKKAALFSGAAIISAAGVFLTSVQYNQAVDKYDADKKTYNSYAQQLADGQVVNIVDMNSTYNSMESSWNDAESRQAWRTGFAVVLLATYTLNIVDILMNDPHDPETAMRGSDDVKYGLDYTKERVLVVRSWRF